MTSHKRARRRPGLARATGLAAATVSAAGLVPALAYADPIGGTSASSVKPPAFDAADNSPGDASSGSLDTVKQQIAALYQQAEASTEQYDATEERIARLQSAVASSSTRSAQLRAELAAASGSLGRLAAEQYRDAGMSPSMALVFSAHPDSYLERAGLTDRVAIVDQQRVVAVLSAQQTLGTLDRESSSELADLHAADVQLAAHRADIEARLAEARARMDSLGAAERNDVTAALAYGDGAGDGSGGGAGDGLGVTTPTSAPSLSSLLSAITATASAATANLGAGSGGADGTGGTDGTDGTVGAVGADALAAPDDSRVAKAIEAAYNELGKPYVWGATGPDQFDCSGLTQHVWAAAGVQLPRTSQEQADAGQAVPVAAIRPGDLVVYYSGATHIGIYVGRGLVIHAPRPGSVVQFTPLESMPIDKVVRPVG